MATPAAGRPRLARLIRAGAALLGWAERHWKLATLLIWLAIAATHLATRWASLHWLALGDTDDNMRYLQVRDWLAGQSWWDLRQHRMNPPAGANIHWSRLVDLPIAALMLLFRSLIDTPMADRLALGIAPLLPLLPLMLALGFITRRLGPGQGWLIAALLPLGAGMGISMYMPMRVDHHGWQLALTALALAGLVDARWRRGGIVAGMASALSVAIGMEMMVYLAGGGALIALRWLFKEGAARRMRPYALALAGTTAVGFAAFASNDNRVPVCDALSLVWTGILILAAGLMLLLTALPLRDWRRRLVAGAVAGMVVAAYGLLNWPQCFTGAYQLSPELQRSWLVYIREAKPIYAQSRDIWTTTLPMPVAGLIAGLIGCWVVRRDGERLWAWATVVLMIAFATGLLFWQTRAGPAAQLLAIPPLAWAGWGMLVLLWRGRWRERLLALVGAALVATPAFASDLYPIVNGWFAARPATTTPSPKRKTTGSANARCRALPALQVLDTLPPATIFTMVDLGPRILATTHHRVIAGPYHRNGDAILAIHHAMDGPPDSFRAIAARHGATYLLICPGFPEGTIYAARSRNGFYARLMRGEVPGWLHPVPLRTGLTLPYTLYRIDYAGSAPRGEKVAQ
jgi:hypothetical protein